MHDVYDGLEDVDVWGWPARPFIEPRNTDGAAPRLMGFRGDSVLEAGYFYAPYVPLMTSERVGDTLLQSSVDRIMGRPIGILTRYARRIANLPVANTNR